MDANPNNQQMDERKTSYDLGELNLLPFGKVGAIYSPMLARDNGECLCPHTTTSEVVRVWAC